MNKTRWLDFRAGKVLVVDISNLEWAEPQPQGYDWIEAYLTRLDLIG